LSVTTPFDSSLALYYKRSIVTMHLYCTVTKIWRLKDNKVTSLTFWGHVTSSVTRPFDSRGVDFLWVIHGDHASIWHRGRKDNGNKMGKRKEKRKGRERESGRGSKRERKWEKEKEKKKGERDGKEKWGRRNGKKR